MQTCSKLYQATLTEIRDKIDPVLRSNLVKEEMVNSLRKDDKESIKKHEESKSRWEKDVKLHMKEECMDIALVKLNETKSELDLKEEIE